MLTRYLVGSGKLLALQQDSNDGCAIALDAIVAKGLPVCSIPFLLNAEVGEEKPFQIEKFAIP